MGGACIIQRDLKVKPINTFLKTYGEHEMWVGIAYDEKKRLSRMHKKGQYSILERFFITEDEAMRICKKYKMLSPAYKNRTRLGCWFCPSQRVSDIQNLKLNYSDYWNELLDLERSNDLPGRFKYVYTLEYYDKRF